MTTRERIEQLLDEASEATLQDVAALLERWRDPVLRLIDTAPPGPPLDEEEEAEVAEAWAEVRRGEVVPAEEVFRGLD